MAKPLYTRSKQYQAFRDKLNEAGMTVQGGLTLYSEHTATHKLLIFRNSKPPVAVIVMDSPEDGYQLFIAVPSIRIDDDLTAILAAA